MHRHRRDTKLLARAQDAQCDFAAIGYEDFIEHAVPRAKSEWRIANRKLLAIRYSLFATQ
jgi:hypothetical protein